MVLYNISSVSIELNFNISLKRLLDVRLISNMLSIQIYNTNVMYVQLIKESKSARSINVQIMEIYKRKCQF